MSILLRALKLSFGSAPRATRFISTTVDEVYQAMRNNPGLPDKDEAASLPRFVQRLNTKLQARLSVQFSQTSKGHLR